MGPAIPFKRLGTAEEVSAATVFLLSEGAAYTSGAAFLVDGALGLVGYPFPMADTGDVCNFPARVRRRGGAARAGGVGSQV